MAARITLLVASSLILACGQADQMPGPAAASDCSFLGGTFKAPLEAATCRASPERCAAFLNACLEGLDFLGAEDLWVLRTPMGAVPVSSTHATTVRALASQQSVTPMHGRFNTIFLNATAAEAFNQQIVRDPEGHFDTASLPYGSVIIKNNFTTAGTPASPEDAKLEGEPWLTVMAKIEGYCNPTIGGSCIGGEWFYYLLRFGNFKQFSGVPVYGKPQAFCTDCHNAVSQADFLWTLHLYVRGREMTFYDDHLPSAAPPSPASASTLADAPLPPSAVCADGNLGIAAQPPKDVPFDPAMRPGTDLQGMFDCFSWRTFVALNWPARRGDRGIPATDASPGDLGPARVWETYKETAEVFQPEIADWTIDDQAWDDTQILPEVCRTLVSRLLVPERAKVLQMITKTRTHQVLNETHQAMGNQFNILVDQNGRLLRYEVRFNRDEFEYLKANGFANTGNYSFEGPKNAEVFFPTNSDGFTGLGATEVKAAWRELCVPDDTGNCTASEEATAARYYHQSALIFTPKTRQSEESCRLSKVGLAGLHIIRKTDHAPQWVWSTFEHVDNVPPAGHTGHPGIDYLLYDEACAGHTPSDVFCSLMRPGVIPFAKEADRNCCPNAQLIINAQPGSPGPDGRLRTKGQEALIKNQVTRLVPVGPTAMNARFQAALPPPWNHYLLLNTQWPSGARQASGQSHPGATRRIPCNVRDLLWLDAGDTQSAFVKAGIPKPECFTKEPRGPNGEGELKLRNTTMETYQAAWNDPGKSNASQQSTQSCFNCHGFSGVDFSFAWTDGTEEIIPFPPPPPITGP